MRRFLFTSFLMGLFLLTGCTSIIVLSMTHDKISAPATIQCKNNKIVLTKGNILHFGKKWYYKEKPTAKRHLISGDCTITKETAP